MNCTDARHIIITDYIDNEVDAGARGEIELHLSSCPACRTFKEAVFSGISEPLRNALDFTPPQALWYKVRARIERLEEPVSIGTIISSLFPKWVNVAAIASIVLVTSLAGNYLAHNIWVKASQQSIAAAAEENDTLALGELNDIPSDQVEKVYSNVIGG